MGDRYFYGRRSSLLQPNLEETKTQRALRNLKPSDVTLHDVFLSPLKWHRSVAAEVEKITVVCNSQSPDGTPEYHLRRNVLRMAHRTKDVGLLMTHYRWVGLLNMGQIRTIVAQGNDILSAITMYHMLLKKEPQFFTKFVNGLLMTRHGAVGNAVEYSADMLELQRGEPGKIIPACDADLHFSMQRGKFLPENLRSLMYEHQAKVSQGPLSPSVDLQPVWLPVTNTKDHSSAGHTDKSGSTKKCDGENQTEKNAVTTRTRNRSSGNRFLQVSRLFQ